MIAALVLAAAPVAAPATLVGLYRSHQMEVGAALDLRADGRFRYQLDYGAVSEAADGRWTAANGVVLLNSRHFAGAYREHPFRNEALIPDGGALLLRRYDTVIRFQRSETTSEH